MSPHPAPPHDATDTDGAAARDDAERAARAVHDPARLAAVRGTRLLDSAAELAFDRLTRLAVRLLGVPSAFFSLVDESRDFYKSACGFGEPLASSRELRGPTFCHYAIASREPLVIPDTAGDPIYRDVPTVRTLGVAAYVGVPLVVDDQVIGSFCVIDVVPRAWTAAEVEVLTELAASAEREIALRAAVHTAERMAAQLQAQTVELAHQVEQAQAAAEGEQVLSEELREQSDELEVERLRVERLLAESERARLEADEARATAEQASRTQAAFLGTMSHEFRTPLNAIGGYAQLLDLEIAGPLTAAQRDQLTRLRASNAHMLGLVNDVLDLAKLDADALEVRSDAGGTAKAVGDALSIIAPQAAEREVHLIDETVGCTVPYVGDDQRVRQVLVNLLSNAIKFSEAGREVRTRCWSAADAPAAGRLTGNGPWAVIEVRDEGVGIAPEAQALVFEPFKQVDEGRTRTRGGTGLGLAISRRLARIMGGDLVLESAPGVGSAFRLWLPAPTGDSDGARTNAADESSAVRRPTPTPRGKMRHAIGLADLGRRLRQEGEAILDAWTARLRADDGFPSARAMPTVQLEDHALPFIMNVAQALVIVEQTGGLDSDSMTDSVAIQKVNSECHGRQRRRLGWSESQVAREYRFLIEEFASRVQRYVPEGSEDASLATGITARLMTHARDAAVRAYRGG